MTMCRRGKMTVSRTRHLVYRLDTHADATGLDDEYRYWAFIEMHPAHIPRGIVEGARKDAIDALHWSYTDRLLTHPHLAPTPPPFSQDECIELFKLLNGETEFRLSPIHALPRLPESSHPITAAYTRTVARILLRAGEYPCPQFIRQDVSLPSQPTGIRSTSDLINHYLVMSRINSPQGARPSSARSSSFSLGFYVSGYLSCSWTGQDTMASLT